eukprot:gene10354-biopygen1760
MRVICEPQMHCNCRPQLCTIYRLQFQLLAAMRSICEPQMRVICRPHSQMRVICALATLAVLSTLAALATHFFRCCGWVKFSVVKEHCLDVECTTLASAVQRVLHYVVYIPPRSWTANAAWRRKGTRRTTRRHAKLSGNTRQGSRSQPEEATNPLYGICLGLGPQLHGPATSPRTPCG